MKKGHIIIILLFIFSFLNHTFSQRLIPFRKGDKWGYSNQKKEVIVEPIFDLAYPLQEGMGLVVIDKMYGYIDSTGKLITDVKYNVAYMFKDGLAIVGREFEEEKINTSGIRYRTLETRYGFIDKKGREIIPLIYGDVYNFQENGLALVGKGKYMKNKEGKDYFDGKWGYINKKGEVVIPIKYYRLGIFKEGLAYAQISSNIGYINEKDEVVIPFKYDDVDVNGFNNGLTTVSRDDKWFYIDKKGNEFYEEEGGNQ